MDAFYLGTVRVAAIIFLICSLVLFLRRKDGERSRLMLSGIFLLSVFHYALRYVGTLFSVAPLLITTPLVFLMGVFVMTVCILYPIEVISPGWITLKRLLAVFAPVGVLWGIYLVTCWCGVEYHSYKNLLQMFPDCGQFNVWFRIVFCALIYLPAVSLFFVRHTYKYSNTNKAWIRKYVTILFLNSTAYILVILFNTLYFHLFYYYCTIAGTLYLTYQELYIRLICRSQTNKVVSSAVSACEQAEEGSPQVATNLLLRTKLEKLMDEEKPWRNPNTTIVSLARMLGTNRTTLSLLVKEMGYDSYPSFINRRRITELLKMIKESELTSIEDAFYEVGFRSKVNALRYFRIITDTTPTEYLQRITSCENEAKL